MKYSFLLFFSIFFLNAQTEIECDGFLEDFHEDYIVSYSRINNKTFYGLVDKEHLLRVMPDTLRIKPFFLADNILTEYDNISQLYKIYDFKKNEIIHKNILEIKGEKGLGFVVKKVDPKIKDGILSNNRLKESKFVFLDENLDVVCVIDALTKGTLFLNNLNVFSNGLSRFKFDEQISFTKEASPFKGKYGYYNTKGEIAIKPIFANALDFSDGLAAVLNPNSSVPLWGFIDTSGNVVIDYQFSNQPGKFREGLSRVKSKDNKYGFINKEGDLVISAKYYKAGASFYKGNLLVQKDRNSFMSLIDSSGKVIKNYTETKGVFGYVKDLIDKDLIAVKDLKSKSRIMNKQGKFLSPSSFGRSWLSNIGRFSHGIAYSKMFVYEKRKNISGFIDQTGKFVLLSKKSDF